MTIASARCLLIVGGGVMLGCGDGVDNDADNPLDCPDPHCGEPD